MQQCSVSLPKGFILRDREVALFSGRPQCYLPTTATHTYGFGGGFISAESDAKVVTDSRGHGQLVITSQRIVVSCRSDVREWPIQSIVSARNRTSFTGTHLDLQIANVGAARFYWPNGWRKVNVAAQAEQAIQNAIAHFGASAEF